MSETDRQDGDETETGANLSAQDPARFHVTEDSMADELRCVQCGAPVLNPVCGRRVPCPVCGFPYPLGDCSDLAEN
jgi:hypothetical protein